MLSLKRKLLWLLVIAISLGMCASVALAGDTTGVTDKEVSIGLFFALTGPGSVWGTPVAHPIMSMIKKKNAEGGIHGRTIKAVLEDDACNPEKAKGAVKKLIFQDKVFALMGTGCSLAAYAAKMEIEKANIPWLGAPAIMDKIYTPTVPTTFSYGMTSSIDARSMITFALSWPNVKKITFVYHFDDWGKGLLDTCIQELKKTGAPVEYTTEVVEKNVTDATAVVMKIKKGKPDVVISMLFPSEGAVFIRDAYKYGLRLPLIFNTASNDLKDQAKRAGIPEAMKWVFASAYVKGSIFSPEFEKYVKVHLADYPKDKPQAMNFVGYGGAMVLFEALERAGRDLTREKFLAALESFDKFDTGLLASPISYSSDDHLGLEICTEVTLRKDGSEYYLPSPKWYKDLMKDKGWE